MKAREYCCCAIPLVKAGIYTTLIEQFSLGIIIGTLSVGTPSIVGAATPSFAPWLLAIACYVGAAIQVLGFIGVYKEKPILFRRYATLHSLITIVAFAIAAAWVIISGSRHSTALSNCEKNFYPTASNGSNTSEGQTVCDIITWIDVGLMAGAWVFFALVQAYMLFIVSSYGSAQRRDYEKYDALNDTTKPLTDNIPMSDRGDPWDYRASAEYEDGRGHMRNASTASTMNAPLQKETYADGQSYLTPTYPPQPQTQFERQQSTRTAVSHPSSASQSPQPNPYADNHYGSGGSLGQPATTQAHPGVY
ncbi:hypothetical protein DEU56DRAFT_837949 [Suillus clintonianus]|uniref:uncharacterized protein n=1 Tax=Suillus clintonianus TaxID=1904413 RepID=UPI001B866BF1|nr:uncharacterized protein DEU56DRAFT_837949 [Suillus clintonianus]KAG2118441.1 hypothetical protein DEU56DRAFT_837949 [Suillus clintonianus]